MYITIFLICFLGVVGKFSRKDWDLKQDNTEENLGSNGYYANINPEKSILIMGKLFKYGNGGCEALVQLSIALTQATKGKKEVFVTETKYNPRFLSMYGKHLVRDTKQISDLKSGDILIFNEEEPCAKNVPHGVNVFYYLLAKKMTCKPEQGGRYISHNQYLSKYNISLPKERIIHPYISISTVERAFRVAGLQRDGVILYQKSKLINIKENILLCDDDVPDDILEILSTQVKKAGGKMIVLTGLSHQNILKLYEKSKVTIDWCMRGSERCPLEASLFGAIVITNNCDTGESFSDFPIPYQYYVYNNISNVELNNIFYRMLKSAFDYYWDIVPEFEPLRRSVLDHNPSSMLIEVTRFLSSVHIHDNYTYAENEMHLLPSNCIGC